MSRSREPCFRHWVQGAGVVKNAGSLNPLFGISSRIDNCAKNFWLKRIGIVINGSALSNHQNSPASETAL